jgi:thiol-disulfide isomerase/thioredoxin
MLALPSLQALHEKYEDQGLRIIGVDPYDKIEDSIAPFLAKRGVTYLVLLDGKKVAKEYHVSAYPTMYLIGRNGKILFSQIGYSEEAEKKLEKIILEHL